MTSLGNDRKLTVISSYNIASFTVERTKVVRQVSSTAKPFSVPKQGNHHWHLWIPQAHLVYSFQSTSAQHLSAMATADIPSSPSRTCAFVCFPCHLRRSLSVYEWSHFTHCSHTSSLPSPPTHPCSSCSQQMSCLGIKLVVPEKDDDKGWEELWRQWAAPGYLYSMCIDEDVVRENRHFEGCRVRFRDDRKGEKTGCIRCDAVWERLPKGSRDAWRREGFRGFNVPLAK